MKGDMEKEKGVKKRLELSPNQQWRDGMRGEEKNGQKRM